MDVNCAKGGRHEVGPSSEYWDDGFTCYKCKEWYPTMDELAALANAAMQLTAEEAREASYGIEVDFVGSGKRLEAYAEAWPK